MPDESSSSGFDYLGLKSTGEAAKIVAQTGKTVVDRSLDGLEAVLSRICLPVAKEWGLYLQDKVSAWRRENAINLTKRLEQKLAENKVPDECHAHPRLVGRILDEASWIDDSVVQDMWAGLLASSCTEKGDDDSNLVFTDLLGRLTKLEASVLRHVCRSVEKFTTLGGLVQGGFYKVPLAEFRTITGEQDIHRLDRELDHLQSLGLLQGGLPLHEINNVMLRPTPLALNLYVRCCGSRLPPIEFFTKERLDSVAHGDAPVTT